MLGCLIVGRDQSIRRAPPASWRRKSSECRVRSTSGLRSPSADVAATGRTIKTPDSQRAQRVGAENLIWRTDQGRCTRKNVGTCRATYVPHSVAPAVRQDPDGDVEVLVSNPIGVFGTHRLK